MDSSVLIFEGINMSLFRKVAVPILVLILLSCSAVYGQDYKVEFLVRMERPWNHYLDVEMRLVDKYKKDYIDLVLPVWIPGSYMVREYSQYMQEEQAFDSSNNPLRFEKISKNKWRIYLKKSRTLIFKYRIFAFVKSIRHCYFDESRAIINGVHLFVHPEVFLNDPVKVKFIPYKGFDQITTGMKHDKNDKFTVYAENFDQLYDCPVEIGTQDILKFEVNEVPHFISVSGSREYDAESMIKHTKRIVGETVKIFGKIPYEKYVFFMGIGIPGGGLEHSNSTYLALGSGKYATESQVKSLLGLITHEYFHTWNVKRIRPFALGPFDYSNENYTRLLWVAEGFTTYFSGKIQMRAGYSSDLTYINGVAASIAAYERSPGKYVQSVEEASFDAWIKYYRRHENSGNTTISYYSQGALLATLLDIIIVNETEGEKCLDDLMIYLFEEYYKKKKRGFKPEEFQKACEKIAGSSLDDFFENHIRGKKDIIFNMYLNYAGLELEIVKQNLIPMAYLGVGTRLNNGVLVVYTVPANSPAYDQGISVNDEIIAVNNVRVTSPGSLSSNIQKYKPGDTVKLTISRDSKLKNLDITLAELDDRNFKINKINAASKLQKKVYKKWLGKDF